MAEKEYPLGKHPNSVAELDKGRKQFEKGNSLSTGRPKGKSFDTLVKEICERKITIKDVITGAKRTVTVNEALMLKLLENGLKKGKEKSLEMAIKEAKGGVDKVTVEHKHILSTLDASILREAGIIVDAEYEEVPDTLEIDNSSNEESIFD